MPLNDVTEPFLTALNAALPDGVLRQVEQRYLEEPRGKFQGQAAIVAAPSTVDEVATIIRAANVARVAVVPYGGGTGLVGGQVMDGGPEPIILSLERMNAIRAVHPAENVLIAEAGAILHDVHAAAAAADRLFPLWLASEGSCRIGGNLATNAGGVNVIRYGNARDLCLGIEAVLPNGDIWHGLKRLRKDNTGYDLRNLLIGSEGTLGVITAASLRLYPAPNDSSAGLFVVPDPAAALAFLTLAQSRVSHGLSAFELISGTGLDFVAEHLPNVRLPLDAIPKWAVLIDLEMSAGQGANDAMEDLFEVAAEQGLATDGVVAQNHTQRRDIWQLRELMPTANKAVGSISSNDISLPVGSLPEFIDRAADLFRNRNIRINCFGHMGDGNLHYNMFPAKGRNRAEYGNLGSELQAQLLELVAEFDGSFSAEHGVGRLKTSELERYGDPAKLAAMRAIKSALDPNGIMNPGAVLRSE